MKRELPVSIIGMEKIQNFRIVPDKTEMTEYTNGWYTGSDSEIYWYYDISYTYYVTAENGDELIFNQLYELNERFGVYPIWKRGAQSYEDQLTVGKNIIEMEFLGITATASVNITEDNIAGVEAVMDYDLVEYVDGWYNYDSEYGSDYFIYSNMDPSVKITFTDNTTKTYENIYDVSNEFGTGFRVADNQSYTNRWGLGTHTATLYMFGFTVPFDVNIVEGPVEKLTLLSDIKTEYNYYEEPTLNGVTLRVEFKDGTSAEKTFGINDCFNGYTINGEIVFCRSLDIEGQKILRISYLNAYIDIPVVFSETEVSSVEFTTPPSDIYFSDAVIKVDYADGQTVEYKVEHFLPQYEDVYPEEDGAWYIFSEGLAFTDKGAFGLGFYGESKDRQLAFSFAEFSAFDNWLVLDDAQRAVVSANYIVDTYITKAAYRAGYTEEAVAFDGNVNADNIDLLIHAFAIEDENMSGEQVQALLSANLELKGEVDLTLSQYYDADSDIYETGYATNHEFLKNILEQTKLENGNYSIMVEYQISEMGSYMYTAEVSSDLKLVSVSVGMKYGDVNGDGEFDIRDMIRLKKMLAEKSEDVAYNNDVNRDGFLNSADLVAIKKSLLGLLV